MTLVFPRAIGFTEPIDKPAEVAATLLAERDGPAIVVVDLREGALVENALRVAGKKVERFEYPRLTVSFVYSE